MPCMPCQRRNFSLRRLFSQAITSISFVKTGTGTVGFRITFNSDDHEQTANISLRGTNFTNLGLSQLRLPPGTYEVTAQSRSGSFPFNMTVRIGTSARIARYTAPLQSNVVGSVTIPEPEPVAPAPETTTPNVNANNANAGTTAKEAKPRYRVISTPDRGGSLTESVRELTPQQVADFRNRGFTVESVSDSVPLSSAIVYRKTPRVNTTPSQRRERKTRPTGPPAKPAWTPIGGRRTRSHNRLVSLGRANRGRQWARATPAPRQAPQPLPSIIPRLTPTPAPRTSRDRSGSNRPPLIPRPQWTPPTPTPEPRHTPRPNPRNPEPQNTPRPRPAPTPAPNQYNQQDINRFTSELKTIQAQLNEINSRTSQQLINLGQSTTDRDAQIQALDQWTQQQFTRINEVLIQLGEAQKDASAGIDASGQAILSSVQQQIDALKATVESAGKNSGILGGLFNTSNLPIILILVVVLLVMIRK